MQIFNVRALDVVFDVLVFDHAVGLQVHFIAHDEDRDGGGLGARAGAGAATGFGRAGGRSRKIPRRLRALIVAVATAAAAGVLVLTELFPPGFPQSLPLLPFPLPLALFVVEPDAKFEVVEPNFNVAERFLVGDIINDDDAVAASVMGQMSPMEVTKRSKSIYFFKSEIFDFLGPKSLIF